MDPSDCPKVGERVTFRVGDVYLPEPAEVLAKMTADVEACGVVVEFSDSSTNPRAYAVVQITREQMVLLPMGALHPVHC